MSKLRKVLLVHDDAGVIKCFEETLPAKGYAVVAVATGEDALWQLDNGSFAAVFTDIALRGMSGVELAEEIRTHQLKLPVIVVSAEAAARERAAAAGVAEFLPQPLAPAQLVEAAGRLLSAEAGLHPVSADAIEREAARAVSRPIRRVKNILLFLLAPVFALGYVLAFPVVGLGMLGWWAVRAKEQESEGEAAAQPAGLATASIFGTLGMMLAVVVFGVLFAVVGPLLGVGLVLWFSFHAWGRVGARAIGGDEKR